jgi:hypothetical protein
MVRHDFTYTGQESSVRWKFGRCVTARVLDLRLDQNHLGAEVNPSIFHRLADDDARTVTSVARSRPLKASA